MAQPERHLTAVPDEPAVPRRVNSRPPRGSIDSRRRVAERTPRLRLPDTKEARRRRRERLPVVGAAVGTALLVAALAVLKDDKKDTKPTPQARDPYVLLSEGQNPWTIAQTIDPEADPRALVDEIMQLNGFEDAGSIPIGEKVQLPAGEVSVQDIQELQEGGYNVVVPEAEQTEHGR